MPATTFPGCCPGSKESARWSHGTEQKGKSEQSIVKGVAGFMNSEGGTLLIGVADEGRSLASPATLRPLSKGDRDGYELFLCQLIANRISGPSPTLCRISFHEVEGKAGVGSTSDVR